MKRIKQSPGVIIAVIALVFALTGGAIAGIPKSGLKLGMFQDSSRDRLAGTGVIQYAAANHTTPKAAGKNAVYEFAVQCELSKKATSGGFKWTGATPEKGAFQLLDAYPTAQGFVVRLLLEPDDADPMTPEGTALDKPLSVYANCVKSRHQRGTPPA